jgi:hypothetical protein
VISVHQGKRSSDGPALLPFFKIGAVDPSIKTGDEQLDR